jgi:hypothetical protein
VAYREGSPDGADRVMVGCGTITSTRNCLLSSVNRMLGPGSMSKANEQAPRGLGGDAKPDDEPIRPVRAEGAADAVHLCAAEAKLPVLGARVADDAKCSSSARGNRAENAVCPDAVGQRVAGRVEELETHRAGSTRNVTGSESSGSPLSLTGRSPTTRVSRPS